MGATSAIHLCLTLIFPYATLNAIRRRYDGVSRASIFPGCSPGAKPVRRSEFLHLSQPTLSRQPKDLEDELGKQFFIRGNRGIVLTNEGIIAGTLDVYTPLAQHCEWWFAKLWTAAALSSSMSVILQIISFPPIV